jgi:hypothetical protein
VAGQPLGMVEVHQLLVVLRVLWGVNLMRLTIQELDLFPTVMSIIMMMLIKIKALHLIIDFFFLLISSIPFPIFSIRGWTAPIPFFLLLIQFANTLFPSKQ